MSYESLSYESLKILKDIIMVAAGFSLRRITQPEGCGYQKRREIFFVHYSNFKF